METWSAGVVLFVSIIGVVFWAAILSSIISSSSRSKQILKQLKIQSELLAKMAEKTGVDAADIDNIVTRKVEQVKLVI